MIFFLWMIIPLSDFEKEKLWKIACVESENLKQFYQNQNLKIFNPPPSPFIKPTLGRSEMWVKNDGECMNNLYKSPSKMKSKTGPAIRPPK